MTPGFIGPAERRLFTALHPATAGGHGAVILCPPFGHEMVRSHRLLRVLAERLARDGLHVLRFDPYGAGDSMGESDELDLDGWRRDLLTAHSHLLSMAGARPVVWMGLRLGATVCALAAADEVPGLRHLVLCSPVVDGAKYLDDLRSRHVLTLDVSLGLPPDPRATGVANRDSEAFRDEALGARLSVALRRQLRELDAAALWPGLRRPATVIVDPGEQSMLLASERADGRLRAVSAAESVDWLSDLTEDGALLPGKLSAQLMKVVSDACA